MTDTQPLCEGDCYGPGKRYYTPHGPVTLCDECIESLGRAVAETAEHEVAKICPECYGEIADGACGCQKEGETP